MTREVKTESCEQWVGVFSTVSDALGSLRACKEQGFPIVEFFSPYPVEEVEEILERRPTRLPWVCLFLGICGLVVALVFQFWVSNASWRMNIGGKPDNSIWAFLPVAFEMTVLAASIGSVIIFLMRCTLFPGVHVKMVDPRVVDDAFAVVVQDRPQAASSEKISDVLSKFNPDTLRPYEPDRSSQLPWGLVIGFVIVALLWTVAMNRVSAFYTKDSSQRPHEWATEMVYSHAYGPFEPNKNFPDGKTLRSPPPGSVARGHVPLTFPLTKEGAVAAGAILKNPFASDAPGVVERGTYIYQNFCVVCHGETGLGDGLMISKGVPAPPSLNDEEATKLLDGNLFFTITTGRGGMPPHAYQLSEDDRWKVVRYIRTLQGKKK